MSLIGSEILAGASGSGVSAYEIEQSLRFDGSSHLNFTPSSTASTRRQMTFSFWSKHDGTYNIDNVFSSGTGGYYDSIAFDGDTCASFIVNSGATYLGAVLYPAARLRDPSAWLHYVMVLDTPNATAADRLRIYINGERVTSFASSPYTPDADPGQNYDTLRFNTTNTHRIGSAAYSGSADRFFSGYLAEVHCVFGSALDPTDFGEFDNNGVWRPIRYTGSYGTNGFYLKFDPTATNGIGHDHSGNGNNFTATGFTTSGTGTDVMSDTPTTNYCTLNAVDKNSDFTLSEGNLNAANNGAGKGSVRGTFGVTSGKWYWEGTCVNVGNGIAFGVLGPNADINAWSAISQGVVYVSAALKNINGTETSYGASYANSDVIGVALNMDDDEITFYKNGTSQGVISGSLPDLCFPSFSDASSATAGEALLNFGQRDFAYTPPTGFKALNTSNLPAPDIADGSEYFDIDTYTGNSSTNSRSNFNFSPNFVWIKSRTGADSHLLFDSVRGATKFLYSNSTQAELTNANTLTSFDTNGFTLGNDGSVNNSVHNYVAWAWDAGGSGSSNTDGSITSTVSANQTAGFSIVTYSGTSSAATVGHGLGVAPSMYICKSRNGANSAADWMVYHASLGATKNLRLQSTSAAATQTAVFNDTEPTSTVFSIGTNNNINGSGGTFVAYCFAEVEGYSKFGSYTGNGSSDGPFVYCGFRPAWVMIKYYSGSGANHWWIWDTARNTYNPLDEALVANLSVATQSPLDIDCLSNGFKLRTTNGEMNGSGTNYIFIAFASSPFGGSGVSPATAR